MRRVTVFSHDELLFKMASIPDALELDLAKKLYDCMRDVVDQEIDARHRLSRLVRLVFPNPSFHSVRIIY